MAWTNEIIYVVIVGIIVVLCGLISHYLLNLFIQFKVPIECADWNKHHIMELSLFMTGIMTYIVLRLMSTMNTTSMV